MIDFNTEPIEARFIRKIEQFRDNYIRLVLRDGVAAHSVSLPIEVDDIEQNNHSSIASFRVAHSDDALVVMFEVEEDNTLNESRVSITIEHSAGEGVFNFEATRTGSLRASHQDAPLPEDLLAQIRICGSFAETKDKDNKWWVIMIIPFPVLGLNSTPNMLRCNLSNNHTWAWGEFEDIIMA
jgi:hypothetical protein